MSSIFIKNIKYKKTEAPLPRISSFKMIFHFLFQKGLLLVLIRQSPLPVCFRCIRLSILKLYASVCEVPCLTHSKNGSDSDHLLSFFPQSYCISNPFFTCIPIVVQKLSLLERELLKEDSSDPAVIANTINKFSSLPNLKDKSAYKR